ncbi:MAG: hypothetical protein AAB804_03260 [Patescibacteria group bacterium]
MIATNIDNGLDQALKERFAKLPKVVQDAIMSADVEKHMRELAETHKLHLDQWQTLENEVMLALLGVQKAEDLEKNIKSEVGVPNDIAKALTENISKIVFEPIRAELERELEHPEAKAAEVSGVEAARAQVLGENAPATPAVAPATPPAEPPTQKVERAPVSTAYKGGETSAVRVAVADDPYREPPA